MEYALQSVSIHVQKVKFKFLGNPGIADFKYNIDNGRFMPCEIDKITFAPLENSWKVNNKSFISNSIEQIEFWNDIEPRELEF